jgi:hypothetical protein
MGERKWRFVEFWEMKNEKCSVSMFGIRQVNSVRRVL